MMYEISVLATIPMKHLITRSLEQVVQSCSVSTPVAASTLRFVSEIMDLLVRGSSKYVVGAKMRQMCRRELGQNNKLQPLRYGR